MITMRSLVRLAPLALLALPFFACSSNKNYAEREEAAKADPEYVPPFDAAKYPTAAEFDPACKAACIGACKPDPGSKPVDMAAAEKGYQFAWAWDLAGENKAWSTYTYDDNTTDLVCPFRTGSTTGYGRGAWEPIPDMVPWPGGPALAERFKGGPFTEYGGGIGMSFRTISNNAQQRSTNASIQLLEQTPSKEFPDPTSGAYDVSTWEGIAIWVRRGPDGQSTMRVAITERNSAEDLNSQALADTMATGVVEGKYCRRWRVCGCSAGTPCTLVPGTMDNFRCYDPAIEQPTLTDILSDTIKYPSCGTTRCNESNSSTAVADPSFFGKSCSDAVTSEGHSQKYCYNPGTDPTPPSKRERCNNPYSRGITVTTDWQLIKVPFSELRQADEALVANEMDLHSVKQLAMTFTGGWIDFWVANIGFYRKLPQ